MPLAEANERNMNRRYGACGAIIMQLCRGLNLFLATQNKQFLQNDEVVTMISIMHTILPLWHMMFQFSYFVLGLLLDYAESLHIDHWIPQWIKDFRYTFFHSVVWPIAMTNFGVFFPMFIAGYPLFKNIPELFSYQFQLSLYVWSMLNTVWELSYCPRPLARSDFKNIVILTSVLVLNYAVVLHTYHERKIWVYPSIAEVYGTLYYKLVLTAIYLYAVLSYYAQYKGVENYDLLNELLNEQENNE